MKFFLLSVMFFATTLYADEKRIVELPKGTSIILREPLKIPQTGSVPLGHGKCYVDTARGNENETVPAGEIILGQPFKKYEYLKGKHSEGLRDYVEIPVLNSAQLTSITCQSNYTQSEFRSIISESFDSAP